METHKTSIVVVGGGTGGTLAANLLAKNLKHEIRLGEAEVRLVSGAEYHIFQPGYLDVAFKGESPEKFVHRERDLLRAEVLLIDEDAERIDVKTQEIILKKSGTRLKYDYLVIATGSVASPKTIPGLGEAALNFHTDSDSSRKVWDALQDFKGGHVVLGVAGVPHKCPASPDEGVFLLDDLLRERGVRDKSRITFVTPYPRPYPAPPMSKVVEPRLKHRGIDVVTFFNVESVDPAKKELYSLEGETLSYDLLIMVPPHRGADIVTRSGLGDQDGWIHTDRNTMRVRGTEDVYAIGDATDIPVSKTGVTAHLEAIVAVNNIISAVKRNGEVHNYNGRINCPFEMGSGKASFVIGTYNNPVKEIEPSRWRYLAKRVFARFYWRTLSGNWDWLLGMYFGRTDIVQQAAGPLKPSEIPLD